MFDENRIQIKQLICRFELVGLDFVRGFVNYLEFHGPGVDRIGYYFRS